ncbi:MAG: Crp/Fnr family transcriptional regulator [Flavobacterium sp.]|nr:MAG: Crp/Fnr family transcriptional regulator [Flavobacterium sp.]
MQVISEQSIKFYYMYMHHPDEDQIKITRLITYLEQYHSLTKGLISAYRENCKVIYVKKNKYILSPVDANKYLYYIVDGVARGFVRDQGQEITTWFAFEHEIIGAIRNPAEDSSYSSEYLQALENCLLVCIPYQLVNNIYEEYPETNTIARKLLEIQYFTASKRSILARIPKALDRYKQLLAENQTGMSKIPLRYIASYLSMRLETLSRIRKKEFSSTIIPQIQEVA